MKMRRCSVVIPVWQGAGVLRRCLAALDRARGRPGWMISVVVSDDGSSDGSVAVARDWAGQWPVAVVRGPHQGPGAARNRALAVLENRKQKRENRKPHFAKASSLRQGFGRQARGKQKRENGDLDIVLFLGADILLRPGALAAHLCFHEREPDPLAAALGWVAWDPRVRPSPLMEWLVHGGPQNDFDSLLGQRWVEPAQYFYGSFVSLKRAVLERHRFSPHLAGYGYEDAELGGRLERAGVRLAVLHDARGLHHHSYSWQAVEQRQIAVGRNARVWQGLDPTVRPVPAWSWPRRLVFGVLGLAGVRVVLGAGLVWWGERPVHPRLFSLLAQAWLWKGWARYSRGL